MLNLTGKKVVGMFYEKEWQIKNQKEFKFQKVIKTKGDKLYIKRKDFDHSFNNWIDKNNVFHNFPKYIVLIFQNQNLLGKNVKVGLDLFNYATKANFWYIGTSKFAE